jgi:hypothetical protein
MRFPANVSRLCTWRGLFGLALAAMATGAFADEPGSPAATRDFLAAIDVGRYAVMVDRLASAEKVALPDAEPAAASTAETQRAVTYRQLVATVLRFNIVAEQICRQMVLPSRDCAGPFRPAWLAAAAQERDDPARQRVMIEEAGAHIALFWGDVCPRLRGADPQFCDIE